jgi:hypothetical protein
LIKASKFFGGSKKVNLGAAASQRIHPAVARWWSINATGAGAFVTLPEASVELYDTRIGFGVLIVAAVGANSVAVKDSDGTTLVTVSAGSVGVCSLLDKAAAGSWSVSTKAVT